MFYLKLLSHPDDFLSRNEKFQQAVQVGRKEGEGESKQGFFPLAAIPKFEVIEPEEARG